MAWVIGLRLNVSGSIAPGLYQIEPGAPSRGSMVLACLPPPIAAFGRRRGYIPRGSCDDGNALVGKTIAAVAGDTVLARSDGLFANGRMLPNSRAMTADSRGRALVPRATGIQVVGDGEVWLLSTFSPTALTAATTDRYRHREYSLACGDYGT
jgi:type IV secretory pathway protease TraF